MILEVAIFDIKQGTQPEFEKQFEKAQLVISQAIGYISHQLQKCLENDKKYMLVVKWQTLEDHIEGFRNSERFTQWRALIGSYFDTPPVVEHFELKYQM